MRDPRYIHLHDPEEFDKRFIELTREYDTYEEAYEAVEREYKKTFGKRKYKNYNSYQTAKKERQKRAMKKNSRRNTSTL